MSIKFKRNSDVRYDYEILDESRNRKAYLYTSTGSGYETDTVKLSRGTYYIRINKYSSYDKNTQYSFSIL